MKNILLTFDVEVFFGLDSGTFQGCVVENTCEILEVLLETESKGLFFIDATHIWFANANDQKQVLDGYMNIIKKILADGHDIGLHLHPHWLDAIAVDDHYTFKNLNNYSCGQFAMHQSLKLTEISKFFLAFVSAADPAYKVKSFRAGGYCTQPNSLLLSMLKKLNIFVDLSVVPKMKTARIPFNFDYTSVSGSSPYRFSSDVCVQDLSGEFLEIPAYTYRLSSLRRIYEKLARKVTPGYALFHFGQGLAFAGSLFDRLKPVHKVLTSDDCSLQQFDYAISRSSEKFYTVVNHPKLLSKQARSNLEKVCLKHRTISIDQVLVDLALK